MPQQATRANTEDVPNGNAIDVLTAGSRQHETKIVGLPPVSVERDWTDLILLLCNAALVVIGFVGIKSALKTLKAIEGQLDQMVVQNQKFDESLVVTEKAAKAAQDSADSLKNAERPWLLIVPEESFQLTPRDRLDWRIENIGRTTAQILLCSVRCRCVGSLTVETPKELEPTPNYRSDIQMFSTPVAPNQRIKVWSYIEGAEAYTNRIFDKDVTGIKDRKFDLVAYGRAIYLDAFGNSHESRFCYYYALPFEEFRIDLRAPADYHTCT